MAEYLIRRETLDAIAQQVMLLVDRTDAVSTADMSSELASVNADVQTQSNLLSQIKLGLDSTLSDTTRRFIDRTIAGSLTLSGVTALPDYALYGCSSIHTLVLPDILSIAPHALYVFDNSLTTLVLPGGQLCTFECTLPSYMYLYVPSALAEEYRTQDKLADGTERIRALEDYPDIVGGTA